MDDGCHCPQPIPLRRLLTQDSGHGKSLPVAVRRSWARVPGAAQHEVVRCRPGTFKETAFGPGRSIAVDRVHEFEAPAVVRDFTLTKV
jgi:hypothetical protein